MLSSTFSKTGPFRSMLMERNACGLASYKEHLFTSLINKNDNSISKGRGNSTINISKRGLKYWENVDNFVTDFKGRYRIRARTKLRVELRKKERKDLRKFLVESAEILEAYNVRPRPKALLERKSDYDPFVSEIQMALFKEYYKPFQYKGLSDRYIPQEFGERPYSKHFWRDPYNHGLPYYIHPTMYLPGHLRVRSLPEELNKKDIRPSNKGFDIVPYEPFDKFDPAIHEDAPGFDSDLLDLFPEYDEKGHDHEWDFENREGKNENMGFDKLKSALDIYTSHNAPASSTDADNIAATEGEQDERDYEAAKDSEDSQDINYLQKLGISTKQSQDKNIDGNKSSSTAFSSFEDELLSIFSSSKDTDSENQVTDEDDNKSFDPLEALVSTIGKQNEKKEEKRGLIDGFTSNIEEGHEDFDLPQMKSLLTNSSNADISEILKARIVPDILSFVEYMKMQDSTQEEQEAQNNQLPEEEEDEKYWNGHKEQGGSASEENDLELSEDDEDLHLEELSEFLSENVLHLNGIDTGNDSESLAQFHEFVKSLAEEPEEIEDPDATLKPDGTIDTVPHFIYESEFR